MRGKMDVSSHREIAIDSLRATLRTIGVMQEYQKHGIANHPAISAEYVRFLVANSALSSVARFEDKFKVMEGKLEEFIATAKAAQATAGTAINRAEEAKKLAAKK